MERSLIHDENVNTANMALKPRKKKKVKPARQTWGEVNTSSMRADPSNADKWSKINDLLNELGVMPISLSDSGPQEETLIFSTYTLIREVQTLRKRVELGDFTQITKLEQQLDSERQKSGRLEGQVFKLEQNVEAMKHQDRRGGIDSSA